MQSEYFGHDDDAWDQNTGKPGIQLFANAVQVWAFSNANAGQPSNVAAAASAFAVEPLMIKLAVEAHYWMYLSGPDDDFTKLQIEHEGE
ncbi:hypothetical protein GR158_12060 [Shinella sp. AETb1-6]|uniref:hypothetical protein n=1 Tax=Shinella sp. AETb1-6 TaxID=2692210 RepID=UPI00141D10B4|nr:hypothetical protein [Shinella sp. AETb1-6]MXN51856.1 hypothetical protein [Shinella sp. AETb1-6]